MKAEVVILEQVADVFNGKTPPKREHRDTGYPVLKIKDVTSDGIFSGTFSTHVDTVFVERVPEKHIQSGDILILNAAHNASHVGSKSFFAGREVEGALATGEWLMIRANNERVLPEFLYYWTQSDSTRAKIRFLVKGIHLYPKDVKQLEIQLPEFSVQRRIVDILKRADGIRRLRKQAQDTACQLIPALFIDMFGDSREAEGTSTATIQELAEPRKGSIRTGPFGSQLKHSEFTDSGIPVLGIDNVVTNRFRWAAERYLPPEKYQKFKRFRVFPGDLIVTIMGTTGRIVVTPDDLPESMSTKHLCVVSFQKEVIQPYYAWASILFDPYVRSQVGVSGHGAIMEGWNTSIVKNLRLRVPPLKLQNEFVSRLGSIQSILDQQEAAQIGVESSFQSLLHRAFSGGI